MDKLKVQQERVNVFSCSNLQIILYQKLRILKYLRILKKVGTNLQILIFNKASH